MEEELAIYEKLLIDFLKIHIPKSEKTYMGICQYPGSRFEEICSRILAYFFNNREEHSLRDLWFRALNSCIKQEGEYSPPRDMNILLEERTYSVEGNENKRIDIVIETSCTVYVIENKIGASLYNDLEVYSKHIEKIYPNHEYRNIVLTAHSLNSFEKNIVEKHNFQEITYKNLFEQVNSLIGEYLSSADVKQLTFMMDFMKTLNNKMNFMENTERAEFFYQHQKDVDKLIYQYEEWKKEILNKQSENISELHRRIIEATGDNNWWIWSGWDLGICFNEGTDKKIGIEASYEKGEKDACAYINIYITTWRVKNASPLQCWMHYEDTIMNNPAFGNCYLDRGEKNEEKRVYLHVKKMSGNSPENIIEALRVCYEFLKGLAAKV